MLKSLDYLQLGLETPKAFQSAVTNRRILKLTLSTHTKLEKFHTAGITALDVDRIEER